MALLQVPESLIQIRAFVRWEEAGKPDNMSPEWQQEEFIKATRDLQFEVHGGTTLNTIRKRYGQAVVEGDDEPVFPKDSIDPELLDEKKQNNIINTPVKVVKEQSSSHEEESSSHDSHEEESSSPPPPPPPPATAEPINRGDVDLRGGAEVQAS